MIAQLSPDCIAIVKKFAFTIGLCGRPKEILETPKIECPCNSSLIIRNVSNVAMAEVGSDEIVIASPSITISLDSIPYLLASL